MNTSYLTVAEYKRAPTGTDVANLDYYTQSTDTTAQDAELANVIARASAWIDNYCELPNGLAASENTETERTWLTRDGWLRIRPKNIPIISLQSLQWRVSPASAWTPVDISNVQTFPRSFETQMWFPYMEGTTLTIGGSFAFPINAPYTPFYMPPQQAAQIEDLQLTVQYSYINGYPNTMLVGAVAAGANSITVDDATGIVEGSTMTIYDGGNTEKVTASSVSGSHVYLTRQLIFDHSDGIAVSAIPADVKQACILIVNYALKERGVNSITMQGVQNPLMQKYDDVRDIEIAKDILRKYRRVV